MSASGRFTCCDVMLGALRSICMFGLALCVTTIAPSAAETQGHPGLAYVVSPPPATRGLMPNYLPKLPPENTATVPQVSTHGARRLRTFCRSCQPRPRHVRRCVHCRHRMDNPAAPHRHRRAGHRVHRRHGHVEQRQPHLPRHRMKGFGRSHRHAPRRWHESLGSMEQCCIASRPQVAFSDWSCDSLPYRPGCRCAVRNPAPMNQQVAIIGLRKSQLPPTSAALMCHFISASSTTRGDAYWRLGGT
jgi:hypothetical protein